jgi:hypothetical protein
LSDAPNTPLWCHGGRRYIKHKVEALNPALWKLGTQEGLGRKEFCGRYVFSASYLTHPPLQEH